MDGSFFQSVTQVALAHPGELAVLLSTVSTVSADAADAADAAAGMDAERAEAESVATQRVASLAHGVQAVAVDRFAERVPDAQEAHAAEPVAARDAQRALVEAAGGVCGHTGAVGLPVPERVAASMLAPELRISPRTMRTRLSRARALMELPTTSTSPWHLHHHHRQNPHHHHRHHPRPRRLMVPPSGRKRAHADDRTCLR